MARGLLFVYGIVYPIICHHLNLLYSKIVYSFLFAIYAVVVIIWYSISMKFHSTFIILKIIRLKMFQKEDSSPVDSLKIY